MALACDRRPAPAASALFFALPTRTRAGKPGSRRAGGGGLFGEPSWWVRKSSGAAEGTRTAPPHTEGRRLGEAGNQTLVRAVSGDKQNARAKYDSSEPWPIDVYVPDRLMVFSQAAKCLGGPEPDTSRPRAGLPVRTEPAATKMGGWPTTRQRLKVPLQRCILFDA